MPPSPAEVKGATIASLSRAVPGDVDAAWEALRHASAQPRIHVFLSSSDIHIMHQLHKDYEQVLNQAAEMVARAKSYTSDIEFSPMDATRSRPEYVYKMLEAVIDAGATTVNIPDTVGYAIPDEFEEFIRGIFRERAQHRPGGASPSTVTTTLASRRRTRSRRSAPAPARLRSASTASASGPGTRRSKRS